MDNQIHNKNIESETTIISPIELSKKIPISEIAKSNILASRKIVNDILLKKDSRLMVIVGPCSIHDIDAAKEYALKLKTLQEELKESVYLVMRVYFEKPRTTVGWKGYLYDPYLNDSYKINTGIQSARNLLRNITDLQVPCSTEHVDTITPQYFGDLLTWAAIGARTTESQIHREMASGLSTPVGFKNGTGGSISIAANAVKAASSSHTFMGCNSKGYICSVKTKGNQHCHIILRGGSDGPNYDKVEEAKSLLDTNKSIFIDLSHANSLKQHKRQLIVCKEVAEQIGKGETSIHGVMIESNLVEGAQKKPTVYGKSITDACIGLEDTETLLDMLSDAVRKRNSIRRS